MGPGVAGLVGAAAGLAAAAGGALLLHPGVGALASAGFLAATFLVSVAAGAWVAAPRPERGGSGSATGPGGAVRAGARAADGARSGRTQWVLALGTFAVAGGFLRWVGAGALLPTDSPVRAVAVLLLLAAPGYAIGWLVGILHQRRAGAGDGGSVAAPVLLGAAAGMLLAASVFIPRADPEVVYLGGGLLIAIAGTIDMRRMATSGRTEGAEMPRRVLITGVGRSGQVGYALAEAFLDGGARVVITGTTAEVERHAAALARKGEVHAVVADLTREADVERLISEVGAKLGGLDVLVNAAGGLSVVCPVAETSPEAWRREIERNATTAFLVSRAALPLLRDGGGAIVNFAAQAGIRAAAGLAAYGAAKASVVALTRALALEEARHGVRVNAILPGLIDTEENRRALPDADRSRWVTREQIASVVLFLASDAASGITGETILVAGAGLE